MQGNTPLRAATTLTFANKTPKTGDDGLARRQQSLTASDKYSLSKCLDPLIMRMELYTSKR